MTALQIALVIALIPFAVWIVTVAVVSIRRVIRRRGSESDRRQRLATILNHRDVVMIPTGDVDLPEHAVRSVAAEHGFTLLGYEYGNGLLRRRCGVFVRDDSRVAHILTGP